MLLAVRFAGDRGPQAFELLRAMSSKFRFRRLARDELARLERRREPWRWKRLCFGLSLLAGLVCTLERTERAFQVMALVQSNPTDEQVEREDDGEGDDALNDRGDEFDVHAAFHSPHHPPGSIGGNTPRHSWATVDELSRPVLVTSGCGGYLRHTPSMSM